MLEIFLIFILIFIVWPLVKTFIRINRMRRQARDIFNSHYGRQTSQQADTASSAGRKAGWSRPAASKAKKITKDVGEYVAFQELPPQYSGNDSSKGGATVVSESQITDVEWEDIR